MELTTIEKFLLISPYSGKGRFLIPQMSIRYGIIGAELLELSLKDELMIEKGKLSINPNKVAHDDPIILDILNLFSSSKNLYRIKYWITKLSIRSSKYKWMGLEQLEKKNLLRIEKGKFLGLIPYRNCYLIDKELRLDLIKDLKEKILSEQTLSEQDLSVLGLVEVCKMYRIFTRDNIELKELKKRVKDLKKEKEIIEAIRKAIMESQTAIFIFILAITFMNLNR